MPVWTPEQDNALTAVARWLETPRGPQVFRLFGYAGTGKSTLALHLAEHVDGDVAFAAFTGKAALVMRSKGCKDARTIHSLIYRATDSETEEPSFVLNDESDAAHAKLIVVDECSMVDEELGRDLLSFGKKVLVLGDPAQLPPVKGGGFFTEAEPDVMLTEVHRQASDNPIIRLSMTIREGGALARGVYGETRIVARDGLDPALVTGADQVLVGLNRTRRAYNGRLRELRGFTGVFPQSGEKLVCLRNNRKKGLLNGALFTVKSAGAPRRGKIRMLVMPEEGFRLCAHRAQGAGLAMGRRDALRRILRLPRTSRALALYGRDARGEEADAGDVALVQTQTSSRCGRSSGSGLSVCCEAKCPSS